MTSPYVGGRPDAAFLLDIGVAISTTVLSVVGPVDRESAATLTSLGAVALGGAGVADLIVDLAEAIVLEPQDCLRCLVDLQAAAHAAAVNLHIAGASPDVSRRLGAAGLSHLLADTSAWRASAPVDARLPASVLLNISPTRIPPRSIGLKAAFKRSG